MYTTTDLVKEIDELIHTKMVAKDVVSVEWVTNEIVRKHLGNGDVDRHQDYETCCSWYFTREKAGERIAKSAKQTRRQDGQQFTFDGTGFEQIQDYYVVSRNGVDAGVPVLKKDSKPGLTYDEMTAIFNRMIAAGETLIAHGREGIALRDLLYPGRAEAA